MTRNRLPLMGMVHSAILALALQSLAGAPEASAAAAPQLAGRSTGLSAVAAGKIDPRILATLAQPRKVGDLGLMGRKLHIYGTSPEALVFPVLIQSDLSDAELAALGARRDSRVGDVVTAMVAEPDLEALATHPGVRFIEASYRLESNLDRSIPDIRANLVNQPGTGFTGAGVIYGLLDDGIDLTHDDFKNASGGSRVLFVWDHFGTGGNPPQGFNYGREYTKQQIDQGQAGQFINDGGHGSHVAGISVGDGSAASSPYRGVAPDADIIAVRNGGCDMFCYGEAVEFFRTGDSTTKGSIDALNYFVQKANALGKPIVVNQSQGVTMGPHDGTTLFEQKYNQFIQANDLIVVVAAGNDQEANWHGSVQVGSGQTGTFLANHDTSQGPAQFLTFELWWDADDIFKLTLQSPTGATVDVPLDTSTLGQGQQVPGFLAGADTVFVFTTQNYPTNQQGNAAFFLQNRGGLGGGNWTVRAQSQSGSSGRVHFYAERNQYNFSVNNTDLNSILGMPGTASEVITVGSYNTRFDWVSIDGPDGIPDSNPLQEISSFSSHGPRRGIGTGQVDKPDLAAPGQWIVSAFAAGHQQSRRLIINDGEHMALSGTSMAAPHVSGVVALMLEKDPSLTRTQVKQILQQTARKDGFTGASWSKDFGHGKLDAKAAVDAVQGGGGNCATPGDVNLNGAVNVLDVVATVNHILGLDTLSGEEQACADLDGVAGVGIGDLAAIVSRIMAAGLPRPALQSAAESPREIAWGETFGADRYELRLDPAGLGAFTLCFIPPRGYEVHGEPRLRGAREGVSLQWTEAAHQYTVVAYDPSGRGLAGGAEPVVFEVELRPTWDGGESVADFHLTRFELSDPLGRKLILAAEPTMEGSGSGGVRDLLSRAWPNPMSAVTEVRYDLAGSGRVEVDVYDAAGRHVRSLARGHQVAGPHTLRWDGRDDSGREVAAGAYFVRLTTPDGRDTEKILVVRE